MKRPSYTYRHSGPQLGMFTREHHIGRHLYIEALEGYRDPDTGRPRDRCLARWRAERSFAHELGLTRFRTEEAACHLAYWQVSSIAPCSHGSRNIESPRRTASNSGGAGSTSRPRISPS